MPENNYTCKIFILSVIFLLTGLITSAQSAFIKVYGENQTYSYKANAICSNYSGGYIMAGQRYTPTTGSSDFCIINVNDTGATLWSKTYGGNNDDVAWDIRQTPGGSFIVAGSTKSVSGAFDIYVIKIDSSGNVLHSKTIGGGNLDITYCIQPTNDSGFVLAGRTQSFGAGNEEFYLIKLSSTLSVQWSRTVGNTNPDYASWIEQLTDNSFIASGYTATLNNGWDILLAKCDSTGNITWKKNYGTATDNEYAYCIKPADDGGYIMAGDQLAAGGSVRKSLIAKTDAAGVMQWCKTFEAAGFSKLTSLVVESNGYTFAGYVINNGQADALIIKTDFNGDTIFVKAIGEAGADYAEKLIKTADGGYALAGHSSYAGNYGVDFYFVKTDSMAGSCEQGPVSMVVSNITLTAANFGSTGSGATSNNFTSTVSNASVGDSAFCSSVITGISHVNNANEMVSIFPNPVSDHFNVSITGLSSPSPYFIYNSTGQTVQEGRINALNTVIHFNSFPAGIYFFKLIGEDFSCVHKIVK